MEPITVFMFDVVLQLGRAEDTSRLPRYGSRHYFVYNLLVTLRTSVKFCQAIYYYSIFAAYGDREFH